MGASITKSSTPDQLAALMASLDAAYEPYSKAIVDNGISGVFLLSLQGDEEISEVLLSLGVASQGHLSLLTAEIRVALELASKRVPSAATAANAPLPVPAAGPGAATPATPAASATSVAYADFKLCPPSPHPYPSPAPGPGPAASLTTASATAAVAGTTAATSKPALSEEEQEEERERREEEEEERDGMGTLPSHAAGIPAVMGSFHSAEIGRRIYNAAKAGDVAALRPLVQEWSGHDVLNWANPDDDFAEFDDDDYYGDAELTPLHAASREGQLGAALLLLASPGEKR